MKLERKLTSVAQQMIIDYIQNVKGLIAVDATVGNGNDTLFLAQFVGANSVVYGFDIQEVAIEITKNKLLKEDLCKKTQLICDSHENIDKYITKPIDVAMFNLGYLPLGDKNLITDTNSTICAIKKVTEQLSINGILTILCYPGHSGGSEEEEAIYSMLKQYSAKHYVIGKIDIINTKGTPPVLYIVLKKG